MAKFFNTTAVCVPEEHYMVNIDERLKEIKALVDDGKYFTINKARQYGKTTTLMALNNYLQEDYCVISMDFQTFGSADFSTEHNFSTSFANSFLDSFDYNKLKITSELQHLIEKLEKDSNSEKFTLRLLFKGLRSICAVCEKPLVLMIDEVDSATNNQVFLDFLSQIRAQYIQRFQQPAFKSVILAGVYDVKNLRRRLRPEDEHRVNSPWNIAADFNIDMSFSKTDIVGMLYEYEEDYHTGMDINIMAGLLYDYTSGYPFLISRLCKLMDEEISGKGEFYTKHATWTKAGFNEAVRMLLAEKNTLFESLSEKLTSYPELNAMLHSLLFTGKNIVYNFYEPEINIATMFGFVKNDNGNLVVANRIFDTWLYNLYLSTAEMQGQDIYKASLKDKSQFIIDGFPALPKADY